jgi:hypothetical protein
LAALTAVMELSYSPQIILPAMLVIVPAYVTSTQFFNNRSVFLQQLEYQRLAYAVNPIRETLEKIGVQAEMMTEFKLFHDAPDRAVEQYLSKNPTHTVVQKHTFELAANFQLAQFNISLDRDGSAIEYIDLEGMSIQNTLADVHEKLRRQRTGAVYIYDTDPSDVMGVITWNQIQKYLQSRKYGKPGSERRLQGNGTQVVVVCDSVRHTHIGVWYSFDSCLWHGLV